MSRVKSLKCTPGGTVEEYCTDFGLLLGGTEPGLGVAQNGKSVQHGWHRQDGVNSLNGMVLVFPNEFLKNSYGELLLEHPHQLGNK